MELQFHKTSIPCLHTVLREQQTQELTQEVRLMDTMPDVRRVLAGWGQILIRGKDWRSSGIGVSGGVMVWTLFEPEDGAEVQCVESWLPFQMKFDIPDTGRDGTISVVPQVCGVDVRSLTARKLMVRAEICMKAEATVPSEVELFTPGDLPRDVQILKNNYPVLLPMEAGEKAFTLEESLSLPASVPGLRRLIRYSLQPQLTEKKVMADKVVIRGVGTLYMLYIGVDGQLHSWSFDLPFSQYAELEREYDSTATADIRFAVTNLELEQGEEENLSLKVGISGQYIICERPELQIVEDAYSPDRAVAVQTMQLMLPAVLENRTEPITAQKVEQSSVVHAADVTFYPDQPKTFVDADGLHVDMGGVFHLLGYDQQGVLQSAASRWSETLSVPADANARVDLTAYPVGIPSAAANGTQSQLNADLLLQAQTVSSQGLPMVTGLELGEEKEPDPSRPSLILQRAGTDSLWDIAKKSGSTIEAIRKANGLQQEPDSEQILLIPIS